MEKAGGGNRNSPQHRPDVWITKAPLAPIIPKAELYNCALPVNSLRLLASEQHVLVSYCCCNKLLQIWWLRTTQIYLTIPEGKSPKWVLWG